MTQSSLRLLELSRVEHAPAISLYLRPPEPGTDGEKARIELQNALNEVRTRLEHLEVRDRDALFAPLERLNDELESYGRGAVAVFRNPERFEIIRVHAPIAPRVEVGPRFHLKPLVSDSARELEVVVLALTLDNVRMFRASRSELTELPLSNRVPTKLTDAVGDEPRDPGLQHHSARTGTGAARFSGPGRAGEQSAFHGRGPGQEDRKVEIETFFQRLNTALADEAVPELPLILAGVDFETAMFARITGSKHLVEETISVSPDGCSDAQLHEAAVDAIEHLAQRKVREAWLRLAEPQSADDIEWSLPDILRASVQGKIHTLFVDPHASERGRFDAETLSATLDDDGPEDLLNLAICRTLQQGGRVFPMPDDRTEPVAALKRFP